jgi:hypothetical protein
MPTQRYHKRQIASVQLQTAILLFLNGRDLSSVITLAGAAGVILERLVRNEGKRPFIDFACSVADVLSGKTPPRAKYNRYISDRLGINHHKHMSPDCPETIEIDLQESAENAITKAVADYVTLHGQEDDFIKAYLSWTWVYRDGPKIMQDYRNLPEKLKRNGRAKLPETGSRSEPA